MNHPKASQGFWHNELLNREDFEAGQSHSSINVPPSQDVSANTANRYQYSVSHKSLKAVNAQTVTPPPKTQSKVERKLPPLKPKDPNDSEEMKRVRNTCAARASRRRKREEEARLRRRVDDLEAEVDYWRGLAKEKGWTDYDDTARYLNRESQSKGEVQDMLAGEPNCIKADRGSCNYTYQTLGTSEMESGSWEGEDLADAGPDTGE